MSRRVAVVLTLLLAAACAKPPVSDEVTIDFSGEDDTVVVTAQTSYDLQPRTREASSRVALAREAAQLGTDPWAVRFARVSPEIERLTFQKNRGTLDRVTRAVRIPAPDLQQVFSDTNITVHVLRGEGWSELSFYPGTSTRASREQQAHWNDALEAWSRAVARYFVAVHHLYSYMDENPQRARYLWAAVLAERGEDGLEPLVLEEEQPLIDEVLRTMDEIAARMDEEEGRAATFAEEADLLFNPFPARITVKVPGDVLAQEGFDKDLVIEPVNLFDTISKLEGRWISPDPLAALLREETPKAAEIAELPRSSTLGVRAGDVAAALREQLERPKTYVVRWRD